MPLGLGQRIRTDPSNIIPVLLRGRFQIYLKKMALLKARPPEIHTFLAAPFRDEMKTIPSAKNK